MPDPLPDFESSLAELDAIVTRMERGDLALEESLRLYERGVELSRACHARLEDAERRIEVLSERGDVRPAPATLTSDADPR
jgi:exodeoxyribonuclease VII small subunit